jgi:hypothetical protein
MTDYTGYEVYMPDLGRGWVTGGANGSWVVYFPVTGQERIYGYKIIGEHCVPGAAFEARRREFAERIVNGIKALQPKKNDPVNHPDHYCYGGIETIDYMRAKLSPEGYMGYLRGTVLKYISRAGHKDDTAEDLKKARWYLDRLIKEVSDGQ